MAILEMYQFSSKKSLERRKNEKNLERSLELKNIYTLCILYKRACNIMKLVIDFHIFFNFLKASGSVIKTLSNRIKIEYLVKNAHSIFFM